MEVTSRLASFDAQLRELLRSSARGPDLGRHVPFESMALDLFRLQFQLNAPFRSLCEARGLNAASIRYWQNIPAVPTSAFKDLEFSCLAPAERTHVFHSSGTTSQRPSRHFHNQTSLAVYEDCLLSGFATFSRTRSISNISNANFDRDNKAHLIVLTPPRSEAPHSSLVYMFEAISRQYGDRIPDFVARVGESKEWEIDFTAAKLALEKSCAQNRAAWLFGTAFQFVRLIDFMADQGLRFHLPAGSLILETGGYKGRSRELTRNELHASIGSAFGVEASDILCEYGMCELSSQAYAAAPASPPSLDSARTFYFPPWARVQIMSPESGKEAADGETGLVRIFDLANAYSVLAIQTEDLAIRRGSGFELLGRANHVEPRGCSIMAQLS